MLLLIVVFQFCIKKLWWECQFQLAINPFTAPSKHSKHKGRTPPFCWQSHHGPFFKIQQWCVVRSQSTTDSSTDSSLCLPTTKNSHQSKINTTQHRFQQSTQSPLFSNTLQQQQQQQHYSTPTNSLLARFLTPWQQIKCNGGFTLVG